MVIKCVCVHVRFSFTSVAVGKKATVPAQAAIVFLPVSFLLVASICCRSFLAVSSSKKASKSFLACFGKLCRFPMAEVVG